MFIMHWDITPENINQNKVPDITMTLQSCQSYWLLMLICCLVTPQTQEMVVPKFIELTTSDLGSITWVLILSTVSTASRVLVLILSTFG